MQNSGIEQCSHSFYLLQCKRSAYLGAIDRLNNARRELERECHSFACKRRPAVAASAANGSLATALRSSARHWSQRRTQAKTVTMEMCSIQLAEPTVAQEEYPKDTGAVLSTLDIVHSGMFTG